MGFSSTDAQGVTTHTGPDSGGVGVIGALWLIPLFFIALDGEVVPILIAMAAYWPAVYATRWALPRLAMYIRRGSR